MPATILRSSEKLRSREKFQIALKYEDVEKLDGPSMKEMEEVWKG